MRDPAVVGRKIGLPEPMIRTLGRLRTPARIQDFVSGLQWNHATEQTAYSVVRVLQSGKAHCLEGAFVAAAALWLAGHRPLLMDLLSRRTINPGRVNFKHGIHLLIFSLALCLLTVANAQNQLPWTNAFNFGRA